MPQLRMWGVLAVVPLLGCTSAEPPPPLSPTQEAALRLEEAHRALPEREHSSLIPYYRYGEEGKSLEFIPRREVYPRVIYPEKKE